MLPRMAPGASLNYTLCFDCFPSHPLSALCVAAEPVCEPGVPCCGGGLRAVGADGEADVAGTHQGEGEPYRPGNLGPIA